MTPKELNRSSVDLTSDHNGHSRLVSVNRSVDRDLRAYELAAFVSEPERGWNIKYVCHNLGNINHFSTCHITGVKVS